MSQHSFKILNFRVRPRKKTLKPTPWTRLDSWGRIPPVPQIRTLLGCAGDLPPPEAKLRFPFTPVHCPPPWRRYSPSPRASKFWGPRPIPREPRFGRFAKSRCYLSSLAIFVATWEERFLLGWVLAWTPRGLAFCPVGGLGLAARACACGCLALSNVKCGFTRQDCGDDGCLV